MKCTCIVVRFICCRKPGCVEQQDAAKKFIRVLKPVEIREGKGTAEKWRDWNPITASSCIFLSSSITLAVDGTVWTAEADFEKVSFVKDVARARTFGFMQDVEMLRGIGLARGGSMENAIVMDEYRILNSDGLRFGR